MVRPIASSRPPPFQPVRRIALEALGDADLDALTGGSEPLIVEGLDATWPDACRSGDIRDVAVFQANPNSVFVNGQQRFGLSSDEFFRRLEAGDNVRIFDGELATAVTDAVTRPPRLFQRLSRLDLFRYDKTKPVCFIGGGGAITVLHHDFEMNANWHMVLFGERQVYLWTHDQSASLFKLPLLGLSLIPFSRGLLGYRFARGLSCRLKRGDLLYMPPGCWHQIEYPQPSLAVTYAFHRTAGEKRTGEQLGAFWFGFMTLTQAVPAGRALAIAALPLIVPWGVFAGLYIWGRFLAVKLLGRLAGAITVPLRYAETGLLHAYLPLMRWVRRRLWMGY
ncbi:MAG: cupin-like domain-containing protein [Rhodospirillaceae bacterium]|nr:cupin-like domain-containing protein [Rhodospirillaceae bacterium]MCA8931947.1 cupin-like domain-containing protein [Rhodospirillaceae bacterium]